MIYEFDRLRYGPQFIRIRETTRQHQRVIVFGIGRAERNVHHKLFAFLVMNDCLDFGGRRGYKARLAPASSSALRGSVSSDCSTPLVLKIAMLFQPVFSHDDELLNYR
jgi:hypothetical protein